ncbi:MAG: domain S-box [Verrucomicrobia bacterium]|nr:domain S-box [Verrucomicrobiota bacterium]
MEDDHEYIFSPVFAVDGRVSAVCGTTRLTTARKRAEAVAEGNRRVLQLIVEDKPLEDVLSELMRTAELQCSGKAYASIMLLDSDGVHLRHAAAPSLPRAYVKAIDGMVIGPAAASCGTAVFSKKPVFVGSIATDPLWSEYKDLALAHGLRACWSVPLVSTHGEVLGTFALYHPETRQANESDLRMVETITRTATIAIERKLSDAAVRASREHYVQLVHGLPTAIYTTDAQGYVTLYNEAAVTLWGRKPELGKDLWCGSHRIYNPDGTPMPLDKCPLAITLKEGRPIRGQEMVIERPDGTRRNVLPYPDPIRDANGRIVGAVSMLVDITESKRAEEASRHLAAIVESSDDAIISKDLNGIIKSWNGGAERLFGYQPEEIIGRSITVLIPPEHFDEEPGILRRIRNGERIKQYETVRRRKDGSMVEISLTVSPMRDQQGNIVGASKIARDITTQKQAERKLEQAHKEAVAASHAKDEFLAALSHELRTPLNPVLLLASDAAGDSRLSAEVRAQFTTIRNNVELEARLIDDLLDITSIRHGKLSLNKALISVDTVFKEALRTVQAEIDQKNIELIRDWEAEDAVVEGDSVRLQQVFWNVLKNAVKFTPENGRITVSSRRRDGQLIVTIADTGIGMTKKELGQVFEAFNQGEHVTSGGAHRFGGLGLGLAITRKLLELHVGEIRAESGGRDQGSTFIITLPTVTAEMQSNSSRETPLSPISRENGQGTPLRILLVEDHEPTRTTLTHLLQRRRYEVSSAATAAEARELAGKRDFNLVISDIGLPDGNGYELMNELLAKNRDLRGIALTGYGMEEDIAKGLAAGFQVHLTKPVRVQSLEGALAKISQYLNKAA